MYRIVVGDDDGAFIEEALTQIRKIMDGFGLHENEEYELTAYRNPEELISSFESDREACRMLMLDIEFGGQNGIELAEKLRQMQAMCSLIYISSYRDYVFDCFGTKPLGYLLKPIDWEKASEFLLKDYKEHYMDNLIDLNICGSLISLTYRDIYAMEASSHRVLIYLREGKTLSWNGSLSKIEEMLNSEYFCKCHNSFLINLTHVTELLKAEVKMDDFQTFPVSRRLYKEAFKKYVGVLKG